MFWDVPECSMFLVLSLNLSLKSNYKIILVQFGINKQLYFFQDYKLHST